MNEIFEKYFEENCNARFVCDFSSVEKMIKQDYLYDVFKDCPEARWDKTLKLFEECSEGYFIFHKPKIDIMCQGEGWYFLDIQTTDFFIRIYDEKEFYYQKGDFEFTKKINKKNIQEMFGFLNKK